MIVVFVGTAGSGKTLLTKSYCEWLVKSGYKPVTLNLDPGVKYLPYKPEIDIREHFTIEGIMEGEKLGPNAAFIEASRLTVKYSRYLLEKLENIEYDYLLVDTPGQMEVFVFHESGPLLLGKLQEIDEVVCVYLIDGEFIKNPVDFLTSYFMSILVQLRLLTPTIPVINKSDLVSSEIDHYRLEDYKMLLNNLKHKIEGLTYDFTRELLEASLKSSRSLRVVKVSALKKWGLEDLHSIIYEVKCACGDLT